MFQRFRALQVSTQIVLLSALLCTAIFSGFTAFVSWSGDRAAMRQAETDLRTQLTVVKSVLDYVYASAEQRAQRESEHFMGLLKGKIHVDGSVSKTGDSVDTPTIRIGDEVINGNNRYLDEMKRLTGTECAILVKKDGELIRAATLLKDKDGKSMAGVAMAKDEGVTINILKGEVFSGIVWRNGRYYIMYGVPVFDDAKKIIGGVTLRVDLTSEVAGIKDSLKKLVVGKTGYIFAYAPANDARIGTFVMHPALEGKTLGDMYKDDPASRERVLGLIRNNGGVSLYDYADKKDGDRIKPKISVYEYLPKFNWMVGSGSFVEEFTEESRALRNLLAVMSLVSGLVTVLVLRWMVRARLQPLAGIVTEVKRMGSGDLTTRALTGDAGSRNEMDLLHRELYATVEQMRGLVGGIAESATQVTQAGAQLNDATRHVAAGSAAQSDAACSVAAAVEQLSVSIAQVADNAKLASEVTATANAAAANGKVVVGDAVLEMENIARDIAGAATVIQSLGERSQQISGIVKVIKDIADQTNLLALNAAIEAARAGEQGRGFAVVADEVRKLAERTTSSTSEIAGMIAGVQAETQAAVSNMQNVSKRMHNGVALAKQGGDALVAIREHAVQTDSVVHEIASATREQTTASEQIARSVQEISGKAEESAEIASRTQRSVGELLALSTRLTSMVQRFKLG